MSKRDSIVRGVAIADKQTADLQDDVSIYPYIGNDAFGEPTLDTTPRIHKAIVDEKEFQRRLSNGQEVTQKAEITIPRPVLPIGGVPERREPIDPRDKVVLPSGYSGPILMVEGLTDPITHNPYMLTVILG